MVEDGARMIHYGLILNRRDTFPYVPKRKEIKMEANRRWEWMEFQAVALFSLLSRWLDRGSVLPKFGEDRGSEETHRIYLLRK